MSKRARKPPRSRAETKLETRAALIAAGIAEFSVHGFDASLDAICARADLTRGAFYVHFADREAFIVAVMQHVLGTFIAALTQSSLAPPDVAAAIRLFLAAVRARSPLVTGAAGLRFHHLLDACVRSATIGTTYRGLLVMARDRLATMARERGAAQLLIVAALGILAAVELDLPLDLDSLEHALLRHTDPGPDRG